MKKYNFRITAGPKTDRTIQTIKATYAEAYAKAEELANGGAWEVNRI